MLSRHRFPASLAAVLGLAVAAATAGPVLAKEGMMATLDVPIAMDTPAGTMLLVAFSGWVNDAGRHDPVVGTPFYVQLKGGDGSSTRAPAAVDPSGPVGHYIARVLVPSGGVIAIEVGVTGSSDLPIEVAGLAMVAGTPGPGRAPIVPGSAGAAAPGPGGSTTSPSAPPAVPWPDVAIGAVVLGLAAVALAAAWSFRRRNGPSRRQPAPRG